MDTQLNELQKWFEDNPKLPERIDRTLLKRFFKCMHYDVEETKKLLETNYSLRNKYAHIFLDRDPLDETTQKIRQATNIIELPGLTPDRCKVAFYSLVNADASTANNTEETKIYLMLMDARFTMADVDPDPADADIPMEKLADYEINVVDIKNYTLGHARRCSISTLRAYCKYLQEGYPTRLRGIHVINCPAYLDKLIALLRPFVRDEVYKMIHFHMNGLESLYEYVPREMLPTEYGGNAGTVAELKAKADELLTAKRDYVMDPKYWRIERSASQSRWSWW